MKKKVILASIFLIPIFVLYFLYWRFELSELLVLQKPIIIILIYGVFVSLIPEKSFLNKIKEDWILIPLTTLLTGELIFHTQPGYLGRISLLILLILAIIIMNVKVDGKR